MKAGSKLVIFALLTVLFAGCITRIDWNSRVGNYTYDQAVVEFGPPDKTARLTDGKLVADWITRYHNGGSVYVSGGYYPGSVGVVTAYPPSTYVNILRLIFNTNNVLCAWSKK